MSHVARVGGTILAVQLRETFLLLVDGRGGRFGKVDVVAAEEDVAFVELCDFGLCTGNGDVVAFLGRKRVAFCECSFSSSDVGIL